MLLVLLLAGSAIQQESKQEPIEPVGLLVLLPFIENVIDIGLSSYSANRRVKTISKQTTVWLLLLLVPQNCYHSFDGIYLYL